MLLFQTDMEYRIQTCVYTVDPPSTPIPSLLDEWLKNVDLQLQAGLSFVVLAAQAVTGRMIHCCSYIAHFRELDCHSVMKCHSVM